MAEGIRATVAFTDPGDCPIAAVSREVDTVIDQVSTSIALPGSNGSVSEFLASDDTIERDDVDPIFSYGDQMLYRIEHTGPECCPCECLGRNGCPVHRYVAEDGRLTLVFHAIDFETLQETIAQL